ncbi:MAG: PilZ domain-containing protein [Gammaproteobacteria bacterium]|nr:PilZ domain-containing protein [Gammaproteobacteria bacterium]
MRLEHRWATRRSIDGDVTITCHPGGLFSGHLLNISSGGALVQCQCSLNADTPVELILQIKDGDTTRLHRLTAIVMRTQEAHIGLRFKNVEAATLAALSRKFAHTTARDTVPRMHTINHQPSSARRRSKEEAHDL